MDSRRRAIMGIAKSGGRLPTAYQEVEYLESAGEQYIDTGYFPTSSVAINLVLSINTVSTTQGIFCTRGSSSGADNTNTVFLFHQHWRYDYYTTIGDGNIGPLVYSDVVYDLLVKEGKLLVDNVVTVEYPLQQFIAKRPLILYAAYSTSDEGIVWEATYKLYSCSINDNDTVVRNFIPCYRKADNKPGLYDLVNDVFYVNANTSASQDFIVGPNV